MKTYQSFIKEGKSQVIDTDNLSDELIEITTKFNIDISSVNDINKWIMIFTKWLEVSKAKPILKDGDDAMKYFDSSIGEINVYFSKEEKEEDIKRWKNNINILKKIKK